MRQWSTISELAAMILARADDGKRVVLNPDTARSVAINLQATAAKPTRDEITLMICGRCAQPCTGCRAKANVIVAAYGARVERL